MKITYLKLKNFVNIKAGMKKTEVEIDFTKSKNKIVLLCGPNGSGKTSLLSEMHPFANSGNMDVRGDTNLIIDGKDGYKEIHIQDKEDLYIIKHYYMFSKKNKSVKSFITKNGVELNENGNVRSFKEVVSEQLGIDQELLKLMRLGSNVTSLINMKSTNRKNFATKLFSDIEVYNGFYKKVSEEYRNLRAVLKSTADKISKFNVQDESEFEKQIELTSSEIELYNSEKDKLQKEIITFENKLLDINIDDEELVSKSYYQLDSDLNSANGLLELVRDINLSKDEYNLQYEKDKQTLELKLLECKSNIDKAISERDIYYNQKQELEEQLKRAASSERIKNLKDMINKYKKDISILEVELEKRTKYDKTTLLILKDHCQKTIDYIKDLNIYSDYDIKRIMESIIDNTNIMKNIETINLKYKTEYDKLNAEIINIESMNINCNINIDENACIKDCPYREFYLQTVGKKNNLNKLIEERNNINKEITKCEELFNLYNSLLFIKNHILSYEEENRIPIEYDYTVCFSNYITGKPVINMNIVNLAIDDSEKFDQLNIYKKDLESFEQEYSFIKASGLDVIEIENKILDINDIINNKTEIINVNTENKIELENSINELKTESERIVKALEVKDSMNDMLERHEELRLRLIEIENLKLQKNDYINKINHGKIELKKIIDFINNLVTKKNQLAFNMETYTNLVTEYNALKLLFEDADEIKEALNSSKGIPLIFLQVYLKNCPIMMNSLLDTIYNGELQIEGFIIDENEFRIPFIKSGIRVPDIVMASQGESSFISIVLSLSLIIQSMTKYDIIGLDELDGPLDTKNREEFIRILYTFIEQVNCEQVFLISHNNMFDNEPIDLILTGDMNVDNYKFANLIFRP
jgi:DNA repair exonuclease SbcCD ATPase subunit